MQNFRILYSIFVLILLTIYIYLGFKALIILTSTVVLISVIILIITRGTSNVDRFPLPVALAPGLQNIFKTKVQVTDITHSNRKKNEQVKGEKMYHNTSFNKSIRDGKYGFDIDADRSVWRTHSPAQEKVLHPSVRQRRAPVNRRHSFSVRQNSFAEQTSDFTLNKSFLPSVKRALGLETLTNSRNLTPGHNNSYTSHPEVASPGFVPAVRLGRHNKHDLSHIRLSAMRSPNTVKIAPPDLQKLCSPRLLEVRSSSRETTPGARLTPDTQSVLIALKEKSRKRTANTIDQENPYIDVPQQKAKRRRQESQQSNASTSSLPPMPDNLPDLSMTGYTIPRLETPTLKRPALLDSLDWDDEDQNNEPKRMRREGRYNSIISSLSSSKRFSEKEMHSRSNSPFATEKHQKRKVEETTDKENVNQKVMKQAPSNTQTDELSTSALSRSDTVLLQPDFDATDIEIQTNTQDITPDLSQSTTPRLKQRVSLNKTVSARKRQMSLYSGLNKSFSKVPQANVVASMEDYTADRKAEQNRVQQMLDDISSAEEKAKKTTTSQVTSVTSTGPTATATGQLLGLTSKVDTTAAISTPIMTSSVVTVPVMSSSPTVVTTDKDTVKTSASSGPATTTTFSFTPVFGKPTSATTAAGSVAGTTVSSAPVMALFNMPGKTSTQLNPVTTVSSGVSVSLFGSGVNHSTSTVASSVQPSSLQSGALATPLSGTTVSSAVSSSFSLPASLGAVSSSTTLSLPTYNAAVAAKTVNQTSGFQMPQTVPSTQQPPAFFTQNSNIQFGSTPTNMSAGVQTTNSSTFSGANTAQFTFGQNISTGQKATTSVAGPSFTFGSNTSQSSVASTFTSTINTTNTKTVANPSMFGGIQQNTSSSFGGMASINSTSMFGGNVATTKSSNFGSGATQGFGVSANTTQPGGSSIFGAANSQFNTGNAVPNSTNSIFGTAVSQTSSGTGFGASTKSGTPSFGAVTQSGTPSFGAVTQSGTSSFGAVTQSGIPSFGGNQQSVTSSFGVAQQTGTPTFGATQQSGTPSFGAAQQSGMSMFGTNTTKSGPVFGGNTTQGSSSSFGNTGKQSFTPVFGLVNTSAQTSGTSVFGSVTSSTKPTATTLFGGIPSTSQAAGTPIFGGTPANTTASSIPTFGAAPTNTQAGGTTLFGGTPSKTQAAGTQLFGAPAPAQSTGTGPVFGANTPKSTTTQSSGFGTGPAAFNFGSAMATPQAGNKGFNFTGNTGSSTPSFNFGAAANNTSTPVFGTNPVNSTPSFGAASSNMFSVGSGQTTPKPRAVARPKRRGARNR